MIDTGADISICKNEKLPYNLIINEEKSCKFTGITKEQIKSLGTTELKFNVFDNELNHSFHIVEDNFPIPTVSTLIIYKSFLNLQILCFYHLTQLNP